MKAEELMVGDLACVSEKGICIKEGTIVRVHMIDATDKLQGYGLEGCVYCESVKDKHCNGGVWCAYLDPIPLTAEILEKNGFKRTEVYGKYEWNERHSEIWAIMGDSNVGEKLNVINIYGWQHKITVCYHNTIFYIHELQHALKMCGIEKEFII